MNKVCARLLYKLPYTESGVDGKQGDALGAGQAAAEKRRQDQQRADQRKHRQIECERTVDPEQLPTKRIV